MPPTCCLHPAQVPDTSLLIPSAIFMASFLGSGHCVAMCGGLVVASARTKMDIILYHFGRLIGYLLLGYALGHLGGYFQLASSETLSYIFAVFMGTSLIILGIIHWIDGKMTLPVPKLVSQWLVRTSGYYLKKSKDNTSFLNMYPLLIGSLSIFLPCGWLYSFALGAMATQTGGKGALLMVLFWLGTLPALSLAPWILMKLLRRFSRWTPKISSLILIGIGILTIIFRFL